MVLDEGDDLLQLQLAKGEETIIYQSAEMPDLSIRAVTVADRPIRPFGGLKPWRLYGFPTNAENE
ncbi:hypothetical protein D3C86_2225300 [compost metagenome]